MKPLLPLLCLKILIFPAILLPQGPDWWYEYDVVTGGPADDYAAANQGQLKHIAAMARLHLEAQLDGHGGAGSAIDVLVAGFVAQTDDNLSPINLGQLKAVAKPFYDRLLAVGIDTNNNLIDRGYPSGWDHYYPWDPATPVEENYAAANIGQLKMVFSFAIPDSYDPGTAPADEYGIPDVWKLAHFGTTDVGAYDHWADKGYPVIFDHRHGTDPTWSGSRPAATKIVDPVGSGDDVYPTIQEALTAVSLSEESFEVIEVVPGHYSGLANSSLSLVIDLDLLLISREGAQETFIDGAGNPASGITVGSKTGVVGFTILNISDGVLLNGEKTWLAQSVIRNTPEQASGAFRVGGADEFVAYDLLVEDNRGTGIVVDDSTGDIRRSIVRGNVSTGSGGGLRIGGDSDIRLENSMIVANTASVRGGAIYFGPESSVLELFNCTIYGNENGVGYSAVSSVSVTGDLTALYTIFWNPGASGGEIGGSLDSVALSYCIIGEGYSGTGNFSVDPLLTAAGFLTDVSPAIDAGTASGSPAEDVHRQARPNGADFDIGAEEFYSVDGILPDWWQMAYFGETGIDPHQDYDGDGKTALEEFVAGTDPTDPLDGVRPSLSIVSGDGQVGQTGMYLGEPVVAAAAGPQGAPTVAMAVRFAVDDPGAELNETPLGSGSNVLVSDTGSEGTAEAYVLP